MSCQTLPPPDTNRLHVITVESLDRMSEIEPDQIDFPRRMTMMTPAQVAAAFQISPRTVTRRIHDGSIPAKKMGTFWRVSRAWVETMCNPADPVCPTMAKHDQAATQAALPAGQP